MDETYSKVRSAGMHLYRAVDSAGNTLEFVLSPHCLDQAAEYFFRTALNGVHTVIPRIISHDASAAGFSREPRSQDWSANCLGLAVAELLPEFSDPVACRAAMPTTWCLYRCPSTTHMEQSLAALKSAPALL